MEHAASLQMIRCFIRFKFSFLRLQNNKAHSSVSSSYFILYWLSRTDSENSSPAALSLLSLNSLANRQCDKALKLKICPLRETSLTSEKCPTFHITAPNNREVNNKKGLKSYQKLNKSCYKRPLCSIRLIIKLSMKEKNGFENRIW